MQTAFKYTTEEKFKNFYENIHTDLIDQDPIEQIKQTEGLSTMLSIRYKPTSWSQEKALSIMECLLYLFEDYEEYETCQSIIEAWPELKINS